MNAVVIMPGLPDMLVFKSAEEVASHLSQNKADLLVPVRVESTEDIISALDFHVYDRKATVGDTVTIFKDDGNRIFKMSFLDHGESQDKPEYNLLASILHNHGHKVWGKAVVTVVGASGGEYLSCVQDDVVRILYRRAWHKGVLTTPEGDKREVEIDNCWNLRGEGTLANKRKSKVQGPNGEPRVMVDTPEGVYLFALLDENGCVLIDLTTA